jgi:hypothetical protein
MRDNPPLYRPIIIPRFARTGTFLVEQAIALRLLVFDWATKTIHRPSPGQAR